MSYATLQELNDANEAAQKCINMALRGRSFMPGCEALRMAIHLHLEWCALADGALPNIAPLVERFVQQDDDSSDGGRDLLRRRLAVAVRKALK